jgi:hypothetical protein
MSREGLTIFASSRRSEYMPSKVDLSQRFEVVPSTSPHALLVSLRATHGNTIAMAPKPAQTGSMPDDSPLDAPALEPAKSPDAVDQTTSLAANNSAQAAITSSTSPVQEEIPAGEVSREAEPAIEDCPLPRTEYHHRPPTAPSSIPSFLRPGQVVPWGRIPLAQPPRSCSAFETCNTANANQGEMTSTTSMSAVGNLSGKPQPKKGRRPLRTPEYPRHEPDSTRPPSLRDGLTASTVFHPNVLRSNGRNGRGSRLRTPNALRLQPQHV